MSRCELTGKRTVVKNSVSHSNIKTKGRSFPNIQRKRLFSQALKSLVTLRLATRTIREIEHIGGLDRFVLKSQDDTLSVRALKIKKRIERALDIKKS